MRLRMLLVMPVILWSVVSILECCLLLTPLWGAAASPAASPGTPHQDAPRSASAIKAGYHLEDERMFENYTVRIYSIPKAHQKPAFVEIWQDGRVLFQHRGFRFRIGYAFEDEELDNSLIAMGRNITGNGIPNLVLSEWSGGAHCCMLFHIFELGKTFRKIATLDAAHGDLAHFADLDGDGKLEFVANDWTFAYWHTSFAGSPAPTIILRYQHGSYRLATDLMRKPAPSADELDGQIKRIRSEESWKNDEPPVAMWELMLNLIYTGHAELAWQSLDRAWPPKVAGKGKFLRDFRHQLGKSPYWEEIKAWSANHAELSE